jgi:uncharacterized protein (TIGR00251 family)
LGDWYRKTEQGWLISVHAQPGAKKSEVAGLHGDALKIRIASPPVDGRANEALIAFVAKELAVPRAAVSLEHGAGSRRKTLLLAAPKIDPERLLLR